MLCDGRMNGRPSRAVCKADGSAETEGGAENPPQPASSPAPPTATHRDSGGPFLGSDGRGELSVCLRRAGRRVPRTEGEDHARPASLAVRADPDQSLSHALEVLNRQMARWASLTDSRVASDAPVSASAAALALSAACSTSTTHSRAVVALASPALRLSRAFADLRPSSATTATRTGDASWSPSVMRPPGGSARRRPPALPGS
jgi:hypothetical protein